MKKFFAEFKKFITRGNIVDMSVGVIVGGAFTAIVNGLSNFILKPIINWLLALVLGSDSLSEIYTYLKPVYIDEVGADGVATGKKVIDLTQSIYFDWGAIINAIINFLLIAFVLFTIVRIFNRISDVQTRMWEIKSRIEWKQSKGLKLNKKERKFLEQEKARIEEEERVAKEEEEKLRNAPQPVTVESLLVEIRDLLQEVKK